jgi:hypothetical protein
MARTALVESTDTLEHGSIVFLHRPKAQASAPDELDGIQRLLILLQPADYPFERLIAVGRTILPRGARHERFWGFVDLVLAPPDMQAALDDHVYTKRTRGVRHLPAARPFATGTYALEAHGDHTHIRWQVRQRELGDSQQFSVESTADYVVNVANPDPAPWNLADPPDLQSELFDDLELHVTLPTLLPAALLNRFAGRRFASLDSRAWLDHPGAELVFAGLGE